MNKQMLFSQWETLHTLCRMVCFMSTLYLIFFFILSVLHSFHSLHGAPHSGPSCCCGLWLTLLLGALITGNTDSYPAFLTCFGLYDKDAGQQKIKMKMEKSWKTPNLKNVKQAEGSMNRGVKKRQYVKTSRDTADLKRAHEIDKYIWYRLGDFSEPEI